MSALRAFLVALKMPQHELTMLGAGFDDVATFATFDDVDVQTMDETLLTAGIPPGHLKRIMDTVRACQDKELRLKRGSSPLKFEYGKQMPLLQNLRDEVRALKEQVHEWRGTAHERELVMLEEHGKWVQSSKEEHDMLRAKSDALSAVKKHLGTEAKKREAAEQAAAAAQQAAQEAAEQSKMHANTRAKSIRRENSELRQQMEALRVSFEAEVTRADAAEKRAAAAEMALRAHEPSEEPPPVFASSRVDFA